MADAKVIISIVTYRSDFEKLQKAVETVHNTLKVPYAIMLVDNASGTHYQRKLDSLDRVNILHSPKNYGFGFGHNLAARKAPNSDYFLVMNPDVEVNEGTIDNMIKYMDAYPDIGLLCPKVTFPEGELQPLNKRLPSVAVLFARRFMPKKLQEHPKFEEMMKWYEMRDVGYDNVVDVPFVSGCFMLFRRDLYDRMGGFDERFFMYLEDCDITRRVRAAGKRALYLPTVSIVHHWERGSHKSIKLMFVMLKSMLTYFSKWGWKWV
ncbi:MAG: glycosyltransferase family 2 protein [Rickettsiales bacterium]|nr:glycosyltransferase family 2 protein [Rickettsiales bacterium]